MEIAVFTSPEVFVSHRNARLTVHGRRLIVRRVRDEGMPVAHVAKAMGLKATDGSVLPDLIAQAPALMESLEGHVYTDLTVEEMVPLALFGARVPVESIKTGSLSGRYMATVQIGGTTERVNTPDRDVLEDLMRETFGPDYAG